MFTELMPAAFGGHGAVTRKALCALMPLGINSEFSKYSSKNLSGKNAPTYLSEESFIF